MSLKSLKKLKMTLNEFMNTKSLNINKGYKDKPTKLIPIQKLEELGKNILKNPNNTNEIIVMVGKPLDIMEGTLFGSPREDMSGMVRHNININDIVDYNSLWEMTKSGWDSKEEYVSPYICVDGEWWVWDNQQLRKEMGIYNWTMENKQKYLGYMIRGGEDTQRVLVVRPKVGRNQPCNCGSGVKYKKCCLRKEMN